MSTQAGGGGWLDSFAQLATVYGQVKLAEAQADAAVANGAYNSLYTMPQDIVQNPNARPLTAAEWQAYLNQQNGVVGGLSNQQLLLIAAGLGVVLLVIMK